MPENPDYVPPTTPEPLIVAPGGVVLANTWWSKARIFFKDSEVIFYARVQSFGGALLLVADAVFEVVSHSDLSPFISNPKTLASVVMANGILTELLRRRRADPGDLQVKE